MENFKSLFNKRICNFCKFANQCNCFNIQKKIEGDLIKYKCLNFQKGELKMKEYSKYIKYTFYEENGDLVAIIKESTPPEIIKELKTKYDSVRFKE